MSEETVKIIIGRAVAEPEFRELLFSDPDKAFEGYELTAEEIESIKGMDQAAFDEKAGELEERISRAGFSLASLGDSFLAEPKSRDLGLPPEPLDKRSLLDT